MKQILSATAAVLLFLFLIGCPNLEAPGGTYTIALTNSGASGIDAVNSSIDSATAGTAIILTATLDTGRKVSLSASGVTFTPDVIRISGGTVTFTMPASDVTITAAFSDDTHSITIVPSGAEGPDDIYANTYSAASGTTITLAATLETEREVTLSADGVTFTPDVISTSGGTSTFTMPSSDVEIAAVFSDILHSITLIPGGASGVDAISSSIDTAPAGTAITLTATLDTERKVSLSADGVTFTPDVISTSGGTSTFTMPSSDVEIAAAFSDIFHSITIAPSGAVGSDAVGTSTGNAAAGTTITLTATLDTGRKVTLSTSDVSLSTTIMRNSGETATFTMPDFNVTVSSTFEYFQIGDTGPEGGVIFYDDTIGFDFDNSGSIGSAEMDLLDGNNNGTVASDRFLEAAPSGWNGGTEPMAAWGPNATDTSLANLEDISGAGLAGNVGNGENNTIILAGLGASYEAAWLCSSYGAGWFLPSLGELKLMSESKDLIDGLESQYLSSSEYDGDYVWAMTFLDGGIIGSMKDPGGYF